MINKDSRILSIHTFDLNSNLAIQAIFYGLEAICGDCKVYQTIGNYRFNKNSIKISEILKIADEWISEVYQ